MAKYPPKSKPQKPRRAHRPSATTPAEIEAYKAALPRVAAALDEEWLVEGKFSNQCRRFLDVLLRDAARDDKSPNSTQLGFIFGSIAHYAAEARCGRRTAVRFVAEIKNSGSQCVIFESGALHHAPSRFWWALNRIPIHANYWREHPDLEPAAVPPAVPVAQIPKPARKPPAKKRERPKRKSREHQESDIAAPEASAPASAPRQKTQAEIAAEAKRRAIFDRLNKKLV